ncbi:retrovirus-related pol polyprotein from transposon TNT 1-94, partial [Tanacetum coccineum]
MNEFCEKKGIMKEFSVARTHQHNGVAERRNRTLIEAARTIGMRPFGCHVTILNTLDHLGKLDGKSDDGFFVGYSLTSKAFRVYNIRTRKVEESLHIRFLENKPIVTGLEESNGAGHTSKETKFSQDYIVMPLWKDGSMFDSSLKNSSDDEPQPLVMLKRRMMKVLNINTVSLTVITTRSNRSQNVSGMFSLGRSVPTTPNIRIYKDHSLDHVIGDIQSGVQTRGMTKNTNEHGFISVVYDGKTHKDLHTCLFACFLSQEEPKRIAKALSDPAWVKAMQVELLKFKLQKVWILVDLPKGKRAISTKWIFRNKKDERGIVTRNKERLVAQGYTQEEGIDYDKVFAPVARIEAIRLFLAYASFMGFMVYQMGVKSVFLYGTIEEEVYACQPLGFEDLDYPDKVYKVYVDDIIFGSTNKELCTKFEKLIHDKFQMSSMGELNFYLGLQVKQREDGIFISQDKYVAEILRKFGFTDVRTASTPMDTEKPLLKDSDGDDVDVHLYRSMIESLIYLTSSRPDIMFAYPRNSPIDLVAYSDSDYARASLDRKSTTGDFTQCKKQTVVATSSTEAEYVAAASCCRQVLWILNQMLDYG